MTRVVAFIYAHPLCYWRHIQTHMRKIISNVYIIKFGYVQLVTLPVFNDILEKGNFCVLHIVTEYDAVRISNSRHRHKLIISFMSNWKKNSQPLMIISCTPLIIWRHYFSAANPVLHIGSRVSYPDIPNWKNEILCLKQL